MIDVKLQTKPSPKITVNTEIPNKKNHHFTPRLNRLLIQSIGNLKNLSLGQ